LQHIFQDENICGIFHWCGKEVFTKYDMLVQMASVFQLPYNSHVTPDSNPPSAAATTLRPYDTTLDTSRLEQLGIEYHTPFNVGIKSALQSWIR
jgi:dTDP-4-dehydrorhamnose reductase